MRILICVSALLVLFLFGFLATPDIFKTVSPDYWLAQRQQGGELTTLTAELKDDTAKLNALETKIDDLIVKLANLAAANAAAVAKLKAEGADDQDPAIRRTTIDFGSQSANVANERARAIAEKQQLETKKGNAKARLAEIENKIKAAGADSVNVYLVTRAVALGAIGALISIFAKFLIIGGTHYLFEDRTIMSRMWVSMAMGGMVAVVVVGLFLTGFISIFSGNAQSAGATDYWKVTILCLFAGAFCDRLFQAASGRMDTYLKTIDESGQTNRPAPDSR